MKYFFVGEGKTNLAKFDGRTWWATDDNGNWVEMTGIARDYLNDGGTITSCTVEQATAAFGEWFPDALWAA